MLGMVIDGDQVFSYWHQERSCKWLALYASNFVPERYVQDKTIEKIMEIEKQIREAEKELAALNGKTAEIVRSYL